MTDCCVYLGDLDDPKFSWDGGNWSGNVPRAISSDFPPMRQHYNADFHAWVKSSGAKCTQTDFGGWVACVTKAQIVGFIAQVYRRQGNLPWVRRPLKALKTFVATLDDEREYALVATEW